MLSLASSVQVVILQLLIITGMKLKISMFAIVQKSPLDPKSRPNT